MCIRDRPNTWHRSRLDFIPLGQLAGEIALVRTVSASIMATTPSTCVDTFEVCAAGLRDPETHNMSVSYTHLRAHETRRHL
eukprot:8529309-Prorocentrum_lima.AAC.1